MTIIDNHSDPGLSQHLLEETTDRTDPPRYLPPLWRPVSGCDVSTTRPSPRDQKDQRRTCHGDPSGALCRQFQSFGSGFGTYVYIIYLYNFIYLYTYMCIYVYIICIYIYMMMKFDDICIYLIYLYLCILVKDSISTDPVRVSVCRFWDSVSCEDPWGDVIRVVTTIYRDSNRDMRKIWCMLLSSTKKSTTTGTFVVEVLIRLRSHMVHSSCGLCGPSMSVHVHRMFQWCWWQ